MRKLVLIFFLLHLILPGLSQDRFELSFLVRPKRERIPQKTINIHRTTSPITLDGFLDEIVWTEAEKAIQFQQYFPRDTGMAISQTEALLTYDDKNLYMGIICHDKSQGLHVAESLRRDFYGPLNDHVAIYLDPYNDLSNGFVFALTPLGIQMEGLISGGDNVSSVWDNVWYSQVQQTDSGWVAEIRIPFKSFRYNDQEDKWNIQFVRNDMHQNEQSTWTHLERRFRPYSLSFSGRMKWDSLPPKAGSNISIIPYLSSSLSRDYENSSKSQLDGNTGFDGKVAVTSALNLDLSFNPDFSTVEVDDQLTNITRFELFFPEKRQFFLENSDLFGDYGFGRSRIFFSRRIGISSPLLFGARLSGQLGKGSRIGFLNAQTRNQRLEDNNDIPALNSTVLTFQKQLFGQSSLAMIFTNLQTVNFDKDQEEGFEFGDAQKYNRVYGLQYNLFSNNNKWEGKFFTSQSDDPVNDTQDWSHGSSLRYNSKRYFASWNHEYIGENYNAAMGFVPRKGFFRVSPSIYFRLPIKSRVINRHGSGVGFSNIWDSGWNATDQAISLNYNLDFYNTSRIRFNFQSTYVQLFNDFDPSRQIGKDSTIVPLPTGSDYRWQDAGLSYRSDSRKSFSYALETGYGGFYNGTRFNLSGDVGFRLRPILGIYMIFSYDRIELPDPFADGSFWLLGPQIDLTFTDKIYWTNYIQYNEQADNINLNSRFQWRFAPVSDLFIVYSENYLPQGLAVKNRSLVVKISYWMNL